MADRPRDLRLFIALELPPDVRRHLREVVDSLGALPSVRWVRSEGIHLTLKFLGNTPQARVPKLTAGLDACIAGVPALQLTTTHAGTFGGKNTRVIWVGVGGETSRLSTLAGAVDEMAERLGFPGENRDFRAHLTLGRVREEASPADRQAIRDAVAQLSLREVPFDADEVTLFRSELREGGAVYSALHHARLEPADQ